MSAYGVNTVDDKINEDTLRLVSEVKKKLKKQMETTKTVTESDVAFATFDVKYEKRFYDDSFERIKSEINSDQNSSDCFDISAAYGNDTESISPIFNKERTKYDNDSKSYPKRKILGNSLENIISPLNQLSGKSIIELTDLFRDIQSVRADNVLRADRMFYSEVIRRVKPLENYTLENAHDQVQAICLMHYQPESNARLEEFITKCRTFESAYSYLQNLASNGRNKGQGSHGRPSSSSARTLVNSSQTGGDTDVNKKSMHKYS